MNDADRTTFLQSLNDLYALYDAQPKDEQVWWSACHRYPLDVVCAAFMAHMQDPTDGKFPPRPADIVRRIAAMAPSDGHVPADEAWAIAAKAMDESETVVMTQQIAEAWGVAQEVMRLGDEVGARMAFRSAYERRVLQARQEGARPRWFPSLGHDPAKRAEALAASSVRLGIPHLADQAAIEDQSRQPPSPQAGEWMARARHVMAMQAPRPDKEVPLDELVAALPEDREARRRALAEMTPAQERRVRHVLGEAERSRQLNAVYRAMSLDEKATWELGRVKGETFAPSAICAASRADQ